MLPVTGEEGRSFGVKEQHAVELARRDFAQLMRGFRGSGAFGRVHPLGVVACDDAANTTRAAHHLVDDVRVPAILGFRSGAEIIDLAGSLFMPNDVLAVASLTTSPLLASIPNPPGKPRLVFRTTMNSTVAAEAVAVAVPQLFEPQVRAAGLGQTAPMRVAVVRSSATRLSAFANTLFGALTFNGKSTMANGESYREITFDEDGPRIKESAANAVRAIIAFDPHVAIYVGDLSDQVIAPVERDWPKSKKSRPKWLSISALTKSEISFIGGDEDRRRRFFGVEEVTTAPPNARFVLHYNESFDEKITRTAAPNASYDAFYLLAYATFAAGDGPITGSSLARAIPRLLPPGKPVDIGVAQIFEAFSTLRRGDAIDLNGATGGLDFDLTTGDATINQSIVCVGKGDDGKASEGIESGVVYDAKTKKLVGAMKCP
jgi:branched-chain amino acid transport system substrate-binding protein